MATVERGEECLPGLILLRENVKHLYNIYISATVNVIKNQRRICFPVCLRFCYEVCFPLKKHDAEKREAVALYMDLSWLHSLTGTFILIQSKTLAFCHVVESRKQAHEIYF